MKMNSNVEEKGVRKFSSHVRRTCHVSLMKVQKLRKEEDTNLIFPPEKMDHRKVVQSDRLIEHGPILNEQLAQRDVEVVRRSLEHLKTRNERIETLKAQVNTGTYELDSTHVAQKMVGSSLARKILVTRGYTMSVFKDEA